jgi:hypothetical protein
VLRSGIKHEDDVAARPGLVDRPVQMVATKVVCACVSRVPPRSYSRASAAWPWGICSTLPRAPLTCRAIAVSSKFTTTVSASWDDHDREPLPPGEESNDLRVAGRRNWGPQMGTFLVSTFGPFPNHEQHRRSQKWGRKSSPPTCSEVAPPL